MSRNENAKRSASVFSVGTCHGTVLAQDKTTSFLVNDAPSTAYPLVLVASLEVQPTWCILVADTPNPSTLRVQALAASGAAVLVGQIRGSSPETLSFYDLRTGHLLCAAPPGEDGRGAVALSSVEVREYELFSRQSPPVASSWLVQAVRSRIDGLLTALGSPRLFAELATDAAALIGLETLLNALPDDDLRAVADTMVSSPAAAAWLARLCPTDLFATRAIPDLARWHARQSNSTYNSHERILAYEPPTRLEQSDDVLASLGYGGAEVSAAYRLNAVARANTRPTQDVCIITTARNEGLYFLDWIAYHRSIGIRDFFVYTNDNDDGSDALLTALARAGVIRWINSDVAGGTGAQPKAYAHALAMLPETLAFRWALIIDLDEHLALHADRFATVHDYLGWMQSISGDAIALNWVIHGPSQQGQWRDEFIARRFPAQEASVNPHIKTMLRPNRYTHSSPHFPFAPANASRIFRSENGRMHICPNGEAGQALSAQPSAHNAWISHFFFRSTQEFLWKWSRNRGDHPSFKGLTNTVLSEDFLRAFMGSFYQTGQGITPTSSLDGDIRAERDALLALPGVEAAWTEIIERFRSRIPIIVDLFQSAPAVLTTGEIGQSFLRTLEAHTQLNERPEG